MEKRSHLRRVGGSVMTVKASINRLNDAMDAMRRPGSRMIQTNYQGRPDFWITPSGGRVEQKIAEQIIAHPQVVGGKDALFPGHHQTWRMRPGDDRGRCDDNAQKHRSRRQAECYEPI
jgi:hypothetical protein